MQPWVELIFLHVRSPDRIRSEKIRNGGPPAAVAKAASRTQALEGIIGFGAIHHLGPVSLVLPCANMRQLERHTVCI
jgi:hypothetical protein